MVSRELLGTMHWPTVWGDAHLWKKFLEIRISTIWWLKIDSCMKNSISDHLLLITLLIPFIYNSTPALGGIYSKWIQNKVKKRTLLTNLFFNPSCLWQNMRVYFTVICCIMHCMIKVLTHFIQRWKVEGCRMTLDNQVIGTQGREGCTVYSILNKKSIMILT